MAASAPQSSSAPRPMHLAGIVALLVVTLVWGTTFPTMKIITAQLSAVEIVAIRFTIAAALLAPALWWCRRAEWRWGAVLSLLLFAAFVLQVEGLARTSVNRNAFVTGLNVLIVPFLARLLGAPLPGRIWLASGLAFAGMAALFWEVGEWGTGDSLTLGSAVFYAIYIVLLERINRKQQPAALPLTAVQCLGMAALAFVWLGIAGDLNVQHAQHLIAVTTEHLAVLLYLGCIASGVIIFLQVWGQRHATAVEAAFVFALEPLVASLAAMWLIDETLGWRAMLGGALLMAGMFLSQSAADATALPDTLPLPDDEVEGKEGARITEN